MPPFSSQYIQASGFLRFVRVLLIALLVVMIALLVERLRGQWALQHWKNEMTARGEVFDATQLWPPESEADLDFSNQMHDAVSKLPSRIRSYASQTAAIVADAPGEFRRGSQESRPWVLSVTGPGTRDENSTNSWEELNQLVQQSQPALQSLRSIMTNPPSAHSGEITKFLETDSFPNFVDIRVSAQALQSAALNDLHNGDLNAAQKDLVALLSSGKLYEQDPGLINFMIRVAILGLSTDVCWDALQADGWTEPQLAAVQNACIESDRMFEQMSRAAEGVRSVHDYRVSWFRSHSYRSVVDRYQQTFQAFGYKLPDTSTGFAGFTRHCVFHPVWSFAWADQNNLEYLRQSQEEITILREGIRQRDWFHLNLHLNALRKNYRPPIAAWRFYTPLPMVEEFPERDGQVRPETYPCNDLTRAWRTTAKNLTLHEMTITAIALKRYELKHGKLPTDLDALVPEFLPAAPTDYMNGQPLHYRLNADKSFTLYSVGDDGHDNGGRCTESPSDAQSQSSPWNQRDWVWPHAAKVHGTM
jgi:hypothetical protein